jgi:subtilisin family serine protease
MAAPHVAGLAALLHAFNPDWTEHQIRNLIISGGDDVASLLGNTLSGKRINAFGSIQCTSAPVFGLLRPLDTVTLKKQTVAALNVDCADGAGALTVTIKPGGIQLKLKDNGVKPDQAANDGIYSASWTPAAKGTYTLKFADGSSYTVVVA